MGIRTLVTIISGGALATVIIYTIQYAGRPLAAPADTAAPAADAVLRKFEFKFKSDMDCISCHADIWEESKHDQHPAARCRTGLRLPIRQVVGDGGVEVSETHGIFPDAHTT